MKKLSTLLVPTFALALMTFGFAPAQTTPTISTSELKTIGDSLALFLESVEKQNWESGDNTQGLAKITPPASFASKPLSEKSLAALASIESGLTAMSHETIDQVNVTSASVKIASAEISQSSPQGIVLTYEVEFLRDVGELPSDQDWMEVIPYEVTLSSDTKSIENIVAKDLD